MNLAQKISVWPCARYRRIFHFIALFLLGTSLLAHASDQANLKSRLEADFVPPDWLAITQVPFTDDELLATNRFGLTIWTPLAAFESDPGKFKAAVATIHRLLKLDNHTIDRAACVKTLAYYYEGMFEDYLRAFYWYRALGTLSQQVRQIHDAQNHNMRDTQRFAALGMARCYARLGAVPEAEALLKRYTFQDWRELFDLAVAYSSMKDLKRSDAAVTAAIAAGARQSIWDRVSAAGRGIVLFYANGNVEQVKRHLPPYQRTYQEVVHQERGKKLADHIIGLNSMVSAITQQLDKADQVSLKQLRDGVFDGESPGFNNPIQVSLTVQNGNLSAIKVTRQEEKRCFNAPQFVPAQILKAGSLEVDGVTGRDRDFPGH